MKRILCLAAAAALLLALTSCDREPTLQEIFESQYGNAYIYEDGEHLFLHKSTTVTSLRGYVEHEIDNSLPYEFEPLALLYDMRPPEEDFGKLYTYGNMDLMYSLTNNSDREISSFDMTKTPQVQQYIDGEWYICRTFEILLSSYGRADPLPVGETVTFRRSLAFAHYNYEDPEWVRNRVGAVDYSKHPDMNPDRYINFPAGRYRIIHDVGGVKENKYVSLEFDLVYEDGMCYLHTVEDE